MKYHAFKDVCRLHNVTLDDFDTITFVLPMPPSWSKKKKALMDGAFHKQTPDLDNLLKALQDAVLKDDSHIASLKIRKIWGYAGQIRIER